MKPLIPILVVVTTSLAVASVQFARQASVQRKRADTELQLRQKQDARVVELERHQARLESELAMARAQGVGAPAPVATTSSRVAGARSAAFGAFGVAEAGPPGTPPPFEMRDRGGAPPAARNFLRTRLKNQIRRLYGDAGQALGLSAEKSNQLLDLIAEQQTRNFGVPPQLADGQNMRQYMQDQQKKNNDEINALIGADKADEWAAYQKSLPQRTQLGAVRDQLEQAGFPMTDSQRTEMLAAITEEAQRLPPRPAFSQGIPPDEAIAQINQWQTEYDKAILDRAKQVLNTDQYNAYKEYQDWQTEMRSNRPRGPNGMPGGVIVRGVAADGGVAVGGPTVNFSMAVPAQPLPVPAETSRK